jgi:hypothetical protein
MKTMHRLLAGLLLAWAGPVLALLNDGTRGEPSELFLVVYDAANSQTYYKDLGVTLTQFLQNPSGNFNLAEDPHFAAFQGKPNLVYTVAAYYALKSDRSNLNQWGYLATSLDGRGIFPRTFTGIGAVRQKMQVYVFNLNPEPYTGDAGAQASGVFGPDHPAYFEGENWGPTLGGTLGGSAAGPADQPLPFYFAGNATGTRSGGVVRKLGTWTLTNGQLGFTPGGEANQPPVANAGADQAVAQGAAVTLDGSGSHDPDQGPDPLAYSWTRIGGPFAALSGDETPKASFTAAQPGTYVFRLTVGDGMASAGAEVRVAVEAATPANQPPVADAGPDQAVRPGVQVVLDGGGSRDPDGGPGPLRYTWTRQSGPEVALAGADTARPAFTPLAEGRYGFKLTVTDGAASAEDTVDITVAATGPGIDLTAPAVWQVGKKQRIAWTTREIALKQTVKLSFARNGRKFKALRSLPNRRGGYVWKPLKSQVTDRGVLKACVKPAKKAAELCDAQTVAVQPKGR